MSRVEEIERENTELRTNGDAILDREKKLLLEEVEEIRKREENLERELSEKLEQEILRMQTEEGTSLLEKVWKDLS
jgi:hypothetical protein